MKVFIFRKRFILIVLVVLILLICFLPKNNFTLALSLSTSNFLNQSFQDNFPFRYGMSPITSYILFLWFYFSVPYQSNSMLFCLNSLSKCTARLDSSSALLLMAFARLSVSSNSILSLSISSLSPLKVVAVPCFSNNAL